MTELQSQQFIHPDDKKIIREIVDTVIANRTGSTKYYGGAADRIIAQLPKLIMDKATFEAELEAAFKREENCYF